MGDKIGLGAALFIEACLVAWLFADWRKERKGR